MNLEGGKGVGAPKGRIPWNKGLRCIFSPEVLKKISESHKGHSPWNKGKHLSLDIRQRISKSRKGQIPWNKGLEGCFSEETKQKMSESNKGNIPWSKGKPGLSGENHPMFGRRGESCPNFGKRHSEAVRQKISETHKGEKTPNWNGGTSFLPYPPIFNGGLKQLIKQRDGDQCQNPNCRRISYILMPHHINYDKNDCHPLNLITLCQSCNGKANSHRKEWERLYQTIVRHCTTENFIRMVV